MWADQVGVGIFAVNALENETVEIDFKPLYLCILIYDTLDAREELQLSYQADRRVNDRHSCRLGVVLPGG